MANVPHSTLTGSELHEPKGIETAALGTVYVANGSGSGTWNSIGTSSFTGMVADFLAPAVPAGWLELNGATISTSTYSALYNVMAIQTSGTRSNGSPVITSIPDTGNMRVGYYVFGTGIPAGTTILSRDSSTQITLSANATSSGSGSFAVSPWLLDVGTIKLPDTVTTGLYRRSRTSATKVGDTQTSANVSHTHGVNIVSGNPNSYHTHSINANTQSMSANAAHTHTVSGSIASSWRVYGNFQSFTSGGAIAGIQVNNGTDGSMALSSTNIDHTHFLSAVTSLDNQNHSHNVSGTSDAAGGTETRPATIVLITCVKT